MTDQIPSYAAGFFYGVTSVFVGQPLDTIKTRMQATAPSSSQLAKNLSTFETGKAIFMTEGFPGLYRGGLPLIVGGGLIRSAQFGVNESALTLIRKYAGRSLLPEERVFGFLDYQVALAGFCGGIGRGLVEGPFEYIKVRRQVHQPWKFNEIFQGSGATMLRNSFLFGSFMIYVDLSKQLVPGGLGAFTTGAVCANLAWLTIWPMDVAKSQIQRY